MSSSPSPAKEEGWQVVKKKRPSQQLSPTNKAPGTVNTATSPDRPKQIAISQDDPRKGRRGSLPWVSSSDSVITNFQNKFGNMQLEDKGQRSKSISTSAYEELYYPEENIASIWGRPQCSSRASNSGQSNPPSPPQRTQRLYNPSPEKRLSQEYRPQRRFSVSPPVNDYQFFQQDYLPEYGNQQQYPPVNFYGPIGARRHSVAGGSFGGLDSMAEQSPLRQSSSQHISYRVPGRLLADAVQNMSADGLYGSRRPAEYAPSEVDEYFQQQPFYPRSSFPGASNPQVNATSSAYNEVGRGVPLHALPSTTPLFIVEFKSGRSDIFYVAENTGLEVHNGDLVIVEADRGKDLGKVINAITPHQIHMLQAQQSDALNDLHRVNREIHPKRTYRLALPQEVTMLVTKSQDEAKAMAVCQTKVRQKKLQMEVVDAEYQWDRRKLTFYFVADRRIDFRELVHDLFKIYKTRIWMCAVNAVSRINVSPPTSPRQSTPRFSQAQDSPRMSNSSVNASVGSSPPIPQVGKSMARILEAEK